MASLVMDEIRSQLKETEAIEALAATYVSQRYLYKYIHYLLLE